MKNTQLYKWTFCTRKITIMSIPEAQQILRAQIINTQRHYEHDTGGTPPTSILSLHLRTLVSFDIWKRRRHVRPRYMSACAYTYTHNMSHKLGQSEKVEASGWVYVRWECESGCDRLSVRTKILAHYQNIFWRKKHIKTIIETV